MSTKKSCAKSKLKTIMMEDVTSSMLSNLNEIGYCGTELMNYSDVHKWFDERGILVFMDINKNGQYSPWVRNPYNQSFQKFIFSTVWFDKSHIKNALDKGIEFAIRLFQEENAVLYN